MWINLCQVKDEFDLPRNGWRIWMNREKSKELLPQKTKTLSSYKVRCAMPLCMLFVYMVSVTSVSN